MAEQNRVTPFGDIVAIDQRGLFMGNRGSIHRGRDIVRPWQVRRWITCTLTYKDWVAPVWASGRWTALFFWDEAVALAAGHRPCALCRREDYDRFGALWLQIHPGQAGADAMDAQLHEERIAPGTRGQRHHEAPFDDLPDGAFVMHAGAPQLLLGAELLRWAPRGYGARSARPAGTRAQLITPPSLTAILRTGWEPAVPLLHPSAE